MKIVSADFPGPPDVLTLREGPTPEPGEGQVRIRVAYASLNPLDVFIRQGRVKWMAGKWPFTPGLEYSGIVDKLGPGVDPQWLGKKVASGSEFGGCAEYALAPANRLQPLAERLGWPVGTAWRTPTLAAWYALNRAARLKSGETILIHSAAGPVGIMATQIARDIGARVISLAGSAAKIAFARPYGADVLFDYRQPNWPQQVGDYTQRRGVEVIIDGNGGGAAVRNYQVIAPNGRVIYMGATAGISPPDIAVPLTIAKSFSIGGFNLNSIEESTIQADERKLIDALSSGKWRFPIGETVSLADVPKLHERFEARELAGRTLIRVGGEL